MKQSKKKQSNTRTTEYIPTHEEQAEMRAQMKAGKTSPKQTIITSVPARIIEQDRKTSYHIIDTLSKTALAISGGENATEKLNVIQALWNMQKEAEDRQAEREFNTAKVVVAQKLPTIPKTGKREFTDKNNQLQSSTYSTLDDIESVLDPICRDHGLIREYSSKSNEKGWACQVLTVRHVGGYKEIYESPYMPLDTSGSKNNQQGAGSVAKYGRRYALIGAFNIYHVDDDTDATGQPDAAKEDKFGARVQDEAEKQQPAKGPATLSLPEAAAKLEIKLRNTALDKRPETLIKHIAVIEAMEKDETLAANAAALRKLCEEIAP